jgi:hypothetical protein
VGSIHRDRPGHVAQCKFVRRSGDDGVGAGEVPTESAGQSLGKRSSPRRIDRPARAARDHGIGNEPGTRCRHRGEPARDAETDDRGCSEVHLADEGRNQSMAISPGGDGSYAGPGSDAGFDLQAGYCDDGRRSVAAMLTCRREPRTRRNLQIRKRARAERENFA